MSLIARYRALIRKPVTVRMLGEIADDPDGVWAEDELIRQIVEIADDHYKGAVKALERIAADYPSVGIVKARRIARDELMRLKADPTGGAVVTVIAHWPLTIYVCENCGRPDQEHGDMCVCDGPKRLRSVEVEPATTQGAVDLDPRT
jgi:hypothetical protein